jgi:hypothetical protein
MDKSTPTHTIKQGLSINYGLLCVLVYFYPCLMTGGIIRYNFESRHYNDDSDKLWFIVCVGVLLPMFDDWVIVSTLKIISDDPTSHQTWVKVHQHTQ